MCCLQSFKEMVAMCLVKDPSKRPSAEKLLKHSFFKHVKSADYIARTILDPLPPLWQRVRDVKVFFFQLLLSTRKLVYPMGYCLYVFFDGLLSHGGSFYKFILA